MRSVIYKVETYGGGFLAVMAKPIGYEWLDVEIRNLREQGVDIVLSLLERGEAYELGLDEERAGCEKYGIEFISYPIRDRGLPESIKTVDSLITELNHGIKAGKGVVIHCRAGIGRTGMIAACVLIQEGYEAEEAIAKISAARGILVPDTDEQRKWIEDFKLSRA